MLDAIVLMKCLDADGQPKYLEHFPTAMPLMERYGVVRSATDTMHDMIQRNARPW